MNTAAKTLLETLLDEVSAGGVITGSMRLKADLLNGVELDILSKEQIIEKINKEGGEVTSIKYSPISEEEIEKLRKKVFSKLVVEDGKPRYEEDWTDERPSILIYGPQGSGKTKAAEYLADMYSLEYDDSDYLSGPLLKKATVYTTNVDKEESIEFAEFHNLIPVSVKTVKQFMKLDAEMYGN